MNERQIAIFGATPSGEQACGDNSPGRMLEPSELLAALEDCCAIGSLFKGKRILITADYTREAIDPVRFLTNRSSGKMGYAVAQAAAKMGAEVMLVSGRGFRVSSTR